MRGLEIRHGERKGGTLNQWMRSNLPQSLMAQCSNSSIHYLSGWINTWVFVAVSYCLSLSHSISQCMRNRRE
jgi:hypothetical protein